MSYIFTYFVTTEIYIQVLLCNLGCVCVCVRACVCVRYIIWLYFKVEVADSCCVLQESIEIKKSTGIPRSFMVPVEGPGVPGAMMTPTGQFAVPAIDQ